MEDPDFQPFEVVGALVVALEPDGRIAYWNRRCSDLTGYSLEEVRGRTLSDVLLVSEEAEPSCWVARTGERHWIAWSQTLMTHADGRVRYVIKTGFDRTETERLHEDLREANEHLVRATIQAHELTDELRAEAEFREMLIGVLGHDLRNPLGTIAMASEVVLQCDIDDDARSGVSRIVASTQRMTRMIVQLLDFARTRLGGGFVLEPKPTSLRDVCRDAVEDFGATVRVELEGDVTGTWDADRLAEALANIAGNAVEHARPGTKVVVSAHAEGDAVVVDIINQGDPIPPDLLPFIFEPFRRAKTKRSPAGNLGLGLYIAKQIVLTSGGTLDARCGDGATTFTMRLPRGGVASAPSAGLGWAQGPSSPSD